jgi:hypothetical protein
MEPEAVNRAATVLRLAAWSLIRSQSARGANRLQSELCAPEAITAMAHKLVRLIYRMISSATNTSTKEWLPTNQDTASLSQTSCFTKSATYSRAGRYRLSFWRPVASKMGASAT